jgi:ABC-2 type transport system ATP-binding protein
MVGPVGIQLEDVSIRYGPLVAVERMTLDIKRGEIFGLLGPNGSGKSTTLTAVAGLLEPAAGSIRVLGLERRERPAEYAGQIGFVPQAPALYDELSAFDNLDFFATLYDLKRQDRRRRIGRVLEQVGLSDRGRDRVGTLSGGMQRRLNIAVALIHDPAVLLLDEPSVALDPASRAVLFQLLNDLREQGRTVVLSTHQLEEAEQWCDRVGILRKGRLTTIGRPADVLHLGARASSIVGILGAEMAEQTEARLRMRLAANVALHVDGRQVRLTAPDGEQLALALAFLASEGVKLDSFRTSPGRLEPQIDEWAGATLAATGGTVCSASCD